MGQEQLILQKLDEIKKEVDEIKETVIDMETNMDCILTEEERQMLDKSIINEKIGKLTSLEEIENARAKAR